MTAGLSISLLGPPLILAGGQPLALSRRGLRVLLYYLACQSEPQTRGQLGLLFWEDVGEAKMRKNLRETFSRLRKELPDPDVLHVDQEYVWLDAERVHSDVREFLSLSDQVARQFVQIPGPGPLPESTRELIHRALGLWRVTRFAPSDDLHGTSDLEAWATQVGNRVNAARRTLLERMADHENLLGRPESAAAYLRAALEIDPVDDTLVIRLLTVLERGGRIAEAAAACRSALETYARHGVDFSPALVKMSDRLRAQDGGNLTDPSRIEPRRSLRVPLVGRESELESLQLAFQRRLPVVVLGEAGAGKSRLLQEYSVTVRPGARVIATAAHPMGEGIPFQPLIDLLRNGLSGEDWRRQSVSWATALALLLPELPALLPEIVLPISNAAMNQSLMFEALYQVLRETSRHERLVILLDNAQWCDETTFHALHYLLEKRLFEEGAFLVVAAREEEQPPALMNFLRYLEYDLSAAVLRLRPLAQGSIQEIVQMVLGSKSPPDLAARLRRGTGGNPFFLLETLRLILEYSAESLAAVSSGKIPLAGSVHYLVRERLKRLSPEAQSALSLAAVFGSEFSLDLLEAAGRYEGEQIAGLVEEIERAQLIQAAPGVEQPVAAEGSVSRYSRAQIRYQFVYEQVREILLMEMSPARRRFFHLRAAEALKGQELAVPEAQAAILAEHYQQAGEAKEAFQSWLKAASHARRLYSLAEQQYAYEQAEKILNQAENFIGAGDLAQLYSGWIELGFMQSSARTARRAAETLLRQGRVRENPSLVSAGYLGLSMTANIEEQGEESLRYLEQVLPFLENGGDLKDWLSYYYNRGSGLIMMGRVEEAAQELESALGLAANTGDSPAIVELRANCGYLLSGAVLFTGWPEKALRIAEKALLESRSVFSHASSARAIAMLGMANYYLGHYAAADGQNRMALGMAQPMQNLRLIAQVSANMAQLALTLGNIDEGWVLAEQAREVGLQCSYQRVIAQAHRVQGDAYRLLTANDEAIDQYRKAVEMGGNTPAGLDALYRLGLALVQTDRGAEGMQAIERCIEISRTNGMGLQLLHALSARALAMTHQGQFDEALALAEEVSVQATQRSLPDLRAMAFVPWGHKAQVEGRLDEARQRALALVEFARKTSNPLMEISALISVFETGSQQNAQRLRLRDLIALIDKNTQTPILRPHIERAAARYLALLD